jgi:hypothetical protein
MQKWLWKMTNTLVSIKTVVAALLLAGTTVSSVQASSLNKCVDVYGKVTYSNLACSGAQQVRKVDIDPSPPVPKVVAPARVGYEAMPTLVEKKGVVKLETYSTAPKRKTAKHCDKLTDKLGLILDKMDAARRKGYTQSQMDKWNLEIKDIEHKKQQASCF